MSSVTLLDLMSNVIPMVPGCEDGLVKLQLKLAARTFARESECIVEKASCQLTESITHLTITPSDAANTMVLHILGVNIDRQPISADRYEFDGTTLIFDGSIGKSGQIIKVEYSVLPNANTDTLPEKFIKRYSEAISALAIANLCAMPKKPWSDANSSSYYRKLYQIELGNAIRDVGTGNTPFDEHLSFLGDCPAEAAITVIGTLIGGSDVLSVNGQSGNVIISINGHTTATINLNATDVNAMPNVTGSTVGQVLVWGGTSWIPGDAGGGSGTVNSVNNTLPDAQGNVTLTAGSVGALSAQGGTVDGYLSVTNGAEFSGVVSFYDPVNIGALNVSSTIDVAGGTVGQFLRKSENRAEWQNATAADVGALSATGGTVSGDIALRGLTASNVPDVTSVGATFTPHVLGHYGYTASNGDTVHITPPDNGKTIFDLDVTIPAGTVSFAFDQFINWKGGSVSFTPGTTQELRFEYVGGTFQAGYREPDLSQYAKADNVIPLTPTQNVGWIAKTDQNRNLLFYGAPGFRVFELGNRWLGWLTIYGDDVCVALASKKFSIKRGDQGVTYAEVSSSGILSKSDVIATVSGGTVAMSELANRVTPSDSIPTAGESYADKVYLYTGNTTSNYKHGHLYQCKLIGGAYSWVDTQTGLYGVGNLSGIKCFVIGNQVTLKWSDPEDTKIGDVTVAKWGKTVLVRKWDGYPTSVDDGTVLVSSTVRDAYKTTPFQELIPAGETYYYRWFIYTDDGVLNDNEANEAVTGELTWASILDMCNDPTIDMRDVFSAGDVLTAANSLRPTDGQGNFQWQVTDVTHDDFGLAAYKVFANLQFDAAQKAYALTADTVFASWKLLTLTGWGTTNGTYFMMDESATGNSRIWRRRNGTYEIRYSSGSWVVFNFTNSTVTATQTTAAADPWGGAWSNNIVAAKGKKYYTTDGTTYTEATVTDGDAVTANTYYEPNPDNGRVNYGSNDYEGSPLDQMLNSDGNAGTFLQPNTIWSNNPSWASSEAGFKKGFDPDFLAAVKDTDIVLNLNTVTAGGGQKTLTRKFFLLSSTEMGYGGTEGEVLEYYNGAEQSQKIKYNISGGAQNWWMRSPYVGYSYSEYFVHPSGALGSLSAAHAHGVVPACRIGGNQ